MKRWVLAVVLTIAVALVSAGAYAGGDCGAKAHKAQGHYRADLAGADGCGMRENPGREGGGCHRSVKSRESGSACAMEGKGYANHKGDKRRHQDNSCCSNLRDADRGCCGERQSSKHGQSGCALESRRGHSQKHMCSGVSL